MKIIVKEESIEVGRFVFPCDHDLEEKGNFLMNRVGRKIFLDLTGDDEGWVFDNCHILPKKVGNNIGVQNYELFLDILAEHDQWEVEIEL